MYPSVQTKTWPVLAFSESMSMIIPDVTPQDIERLRKDLKEVNPYIYHLGCVQLNCWSREAYFPGIPLSKGLWYATLFHDRSSCKVPLECSKEDIRTTLEYFCHLYETRN